MTCPWCGNGALASTGRLGQLGNRRHYRCRNCGGMSSRLAHSRPKRPTPDVAPEPMECLAEYQDHGGEA